DDAAELIAFARTHDAHPRFRADIKNYIDLLFSIAIAAIEEYEGYKKQRGLIDYTDMEVLVKRLLEKERVSRILREELDLVMVDEFQDTNPIQLEIFLRLSRLASQSVWVGDPKQSIYGFRGADPELMRMLIREMGDIGPEDIQTHSWRSREDIVYATNALFTRAFPDVPPEQVSLRPVRKISGGEDPHPFSPEPIEMDTALMHWHFIPEEKRVPGRPWAENGIAWSLRDMLAGKKYILPKGEEKVRPARPGDVAVLCRSNYECTLVAEALHRAGLKAAISRSGLLHSAESKLVIACLKYLLQWEDSLSVAEIMRLAGETRLEEIVESRLRYLEGGSGGRWGSEDPLIARLDQLREQVVELSSAELLDLLLEELQLRFIVAGWSNPGQRLDNIEELRRLALKYEENCNRLHSAASLGGFLLWLDDLERKEEDMQASGDSPNAVNVLTYHRSKGLEWPIVVCHSLENNLRADLWGVQIVSESEEIDIDDVLGNRRLRYMVNPYSNQVKGTSVYERLEESEIKSQREKQALKEEARLLYVGMTRARDYLIFVSRKGKPTSWLNRVWNDGEEQQPTLDPTSGQSPWSWGGRQIPIDSQQKVYARDFPQSDPVETEEFYFERPAGKKAFPPVRIDLRGSESTPDCELQIISETSLGEGAPAYHRLDHPNTVSAMSRAFLRAFQSTYSDSELLTIARGLLERYELEKEMEAGELLALGRSFFGELHKKFEVEELYREYPLHCYYEERLFTTSLDLLLNTKDGRVIIRYGEFASDRKGRIRRAKDLAPHVLMVELGIRKLFPGENIRHFVYFPLSAVLIECSPRQIEKK
ncbi:MAG: UvrD-helicase domain-containing protein, partial [Saprospiraceae bacterium]|nr:UvrD-helicase domain-containing protein [Saprospiraceae bacterium]